MPGGTALRLYAFRAVLLRFGSAFANSGRDCSDWLLSIVCTQGMRAFSHMSDMKCEALKAMPVTHLLGDASVLMLELVLVVPPHSRYTTLYTTHTRYATSHLFVAQLASYTR